MEIGMSEEFIKMGFTPLQAVIPIDYEWDRYRNACWPKVTHESRRAT